MLQYKVKKNKVWQCSKKKKSTRRIVSWSKFYSSWIQKGKNLNLVHEKLRAIMFCFVLFLKHILIYWNTYTYVLNTYFPHGQLSFPSWASKDTRMCGSCLCFLQWDPFLSRCATTSTTRKLILIAQSYTMQDVTASMCWYQARLTQKLDLLSMQRQNCSEGSCLQRSATSHDLSKLP